ncbi:MAG: hypothetical protein FJW39_22570 [Acidobacteria bacterium]|nr:hypothetical protein [Acidobacteriota bacterium]
MVLPCGAVVLAPPLTPAKEVRMSIEIFDHGFKSVGERDPEGMVRVVGGVGWDVPLIVKPVEREISLRFRADLLYHVTMPEGARLFHFEAESNFRTADADDALMRSVAASMLHGIDIEPLLVLFDPRRPALAFDPVRIIVRGKVKLEVGFGVKRLYQVKPDEIFSHDRVQMMPMVFGMDSTEDHIDQAIRRMMQQPVQERRRLLQEAAAYGTILYTKSRLEDLMGRRNELMLPPAELVRGTEVGQEIFRDGLTEGRLEGGIHLVRRVLVDRFPELVVPDSALPSGERDLAELLKRIYSTDDPESIRKFLLGS